MTTKLSQIRKAKMRAQMGLCHYCRQPMWSVDPKAFCARFGVTPRQALHLQCTAEHLRARCEGGGDSSQNIVAACWYCNRMRHRSRKPKSPEDYARMVRIRLAAGGWHRFVAQPPG